MWKSTLAEPVSGAFSVRRAVTIHSPSRLAFLTLFTFYPSLHRMAMRPGWDKARPETKIRYIDVEVQNDNQKLFPLRMLRYYTDIALLYPDILIKQYTIYIGKDALSMSNHIQHEDWCYEYQILDMRDIDCSTLIERDTPESLVLAILCDFEKRPKQDVALLFGKALKTASCWQ